MATPVKKWLLRVAPWFLPVGIVAVWQLAFSSWLAVNAYFALTGRSGDGVLGRSPLAANCGSIWRSAPGGRSLAFQLADRWG